MGKVNESREMRSKVGGSRQAGLSEAVRGGGAGVGLTIIKSRVRAPASDILLESSPCLSL